VGLDAAQRGDAGTCDGQQESSSTRHCFTPLTLSLRRVIHPLAAQAPAYTDVCATPSRAMSAPAAAS
jgi:hypothetical protein